MMTYRVRMMASSTARLCFWCVFLLLASFVQSALAAEPVGWRTDGTGKYPDANPPIHWSLTENVVWATPMPSWSNSTPIIVGDRLFVCSEPSTLVCVRLSDGHILWQSTNDYEETVSPQEAADIRRQRAEAQGLRQQLKPVEAELNNLKQEVQDNPDDAELRDKIAVLEQQRKGLQDQLAAYDEAWWQLPPTHEVNGYSSPTPVSDGQHVYVVFGTGVVACYDLDGNRKWIRLLEKPEQPEDRGHSASPLLVEGKLLVHILHLTALNPETGETLWQVRLPESWGTPLEARIGDVAVVVTPAGDVVNITDGRVLAVSQAKLDYCAPIVEGHLVYFVQKGGKALRLPTGVAETVAAEVLWETNPRDDRYYASPVIYEGLIYAVTQKGILSVIDANTGQVVREQTLALGSGTAYPSISLAGSHIYISKDSGITLVLQPGREYQEVAVNTLEAFRSCLVFAGARMYVRGLQHLYCIRAE